MVDADLKSSDRALSIKKNFASDLRECTLHHVVGLTYCTGQGGTGWTSYGAADGEAH